MTSTALADRFSSGGDAAVEAEEAARASRGGGISFRRTFYLPKMKHKEIIYLRYLTDSKANPALGVKAWTYVDSHPGAPTKAQPADWPEGRNFPKSMPAVCRHDKAFKANPEKGWDAIYNDCYICDAELVDSWGKVCTPKVRVYALAVIRVPVLGTEEMVAAGQIDASMVGKRVGMADATREVEVPQKDEKGDFVKGPDGKFVVDKVIEPAIIVVNQPVGNYFAGLNSMYGMYGTVCDRDYAVQRHNEGSDTEYQHIPLDPIPSLKPGEPAWQRYLDAIEEQGESVDIPTILQEKSSDEYFATFFDPSKQAPARKGGESKPQEQSSGGGAPQQQQQSAPTNEADEATLAALRARVRGKAGSEQEAAPAAAAAPAEEAASSAPATGQIDFG